MNTTEADTVLEILSGYWPTPALTDEEIKAWYVELCGPLKITTEEASKVIAAQARSGQEWRMRPGQIVIEVQQLRRRRALDRPLPALPSGDQILRGDELVAKVAELRQRCGLVRGVAPVTAKGVSRGEA